MSFDDLPTLPSTWTAPTSCFVSTNYYRVLLGGGYFSNMYGTPTPVLTGNKPTGNCFPPSFTIDIPYLTDGGCPSGYTKACATAGSSAGQVVSTVTCCPRFVTGDVFSFMCRGNQYGCHATATKGVIWTGVVTDIGLDTPTERPITRTPSTDEGCEAWGIKFISVSHSTTTTTPRTTVSTHETSNTSERTTSSSAEPTYKASSEVEGTLKTNALGTSSIVGITVGVIAGVALLAIGAVFFRRRRKQRQQQSANVFSPILYKLTPAQKEIYQLETQERPQLLDPQDPRSDVRPRWELSG
ncbi:hypothetical protein BGZ63DRAFT_358899 [Mariannaea sp. PMI_226]|nr:hypothetical protein BGZ63DRAFT_358899 [Mariannaea sp. PMI_226]